MTGAKTVFIIGDGFLDHGVAEEPASAHSADMHATSGGMPAVRASHLVTLTGGVWALGAYLKDRLSSMIDVACVPNVAQQYAFTDKEATPPRNFIDLRLKAGEMRWNSEAKRWLPSEARAYRVSGGHGTEAAGNQFKEAFSALLGSNQVVELAQEADVLVISDRNVFFRGLLTPKDTCLDKFGKILEKFSKRSRGDTEASGHHVVVEVTDPDERFVKVLDLLKKNGLLDKTVFVLSTNSVRMVGLELKDELSLESTVETFVHHVASDISRKDGVFSWLSQAQHVVVRVGIRAAIVWTPVRAEVSPLGQGDEALLVETGVSKKVSRRDRIGDVGRVELVYPIDAYNHMLGAGIESSDLGVVYGYTSLLTAELVCKVVASGNWSELNSGVANGLFSCKEHFLSGLGDSVESLLKRKETLKAPCAEKFKRGDADFWAIDVPLGLRVRNWTILGANSSSRPVAKAKGNAGNLPYEIVHRGIRVLSDFGIPVAKYVDLQTADRQEIERYSVIASLVSKYIETSTWRRPLCLAVFGPPGCGKSFGISQVANSITALKPESRLTPMPFNLSQMRSVDSLARAFHQVRNRGLAGDMPLVLLDEFDSGLNGEEFGWLKYLLAPMQDGQFLDGDEILHLPRCVIVCIGGQNRDFKELEGRLRHKGFLDAKGRDFVSRLRCNLEVKGPDAYYRGDEGDDAESEAGGNAESEEGVGEFDRMVRRAMLLRSTLEQRLPVILQEVKVDGKVYKQANIDDAVIRGFLTIPEYKHGVRSLEAIVEMSRALVTRRCFLKSSLPPEEQLDMHVDARRFLDIVRRSPERVH